ncbi:hypothetical protein sscle_08g062450 [Sclerotinia sclerotiorum 1980 UF-70]|uniref:Uncharacterized protein n=1 Tax=Sclerotinia sclerotiorum (strain ATCC 18683 / 1980 / Ss-1) TaxID=665079 RepID=A0A1D9Q977_SCLS1|nr:hypothetical protein sscle_08g062450 [Sclerotinia sclerotiorum 1980 UF-70]
MAEVLGGIASGISIVQPGGNLASGIIKLKDYWDQIEDALDNIAFLMREIESHQVILRSILETQARVRYPNQATGGFFEHSIKLCQNACRELDDLVTNLAKDVSSNRKWRRKLGSTKVVLKADELKRLKKRMKSASRSLYLAISGQTNTVLQQQSSTIISSVQALDHLLIQFQGHVFYPRVPESISKASMNSAVLLRWLPSRKMTPLHIAAYNSHIDMCKLLLLAGADVSAGDHASGRTPLGQVVALAGPPYTMEYRLKQEPFEVVRILTERGADEELLEDTTIFESSHGPEDVFNYIQHHTFWKEPSFAEKRIVFTRMIKEKGLWADGAQLIRSFLGGPNLSSRIMLHRTETPIIELFGIMWVRLAIVRSFKAKERWNDPMLVQSSKSWEKLVREMTASGITLHGPYGPSCYEMTPLQGSLVDSLGVFGISHCEILLDWLEILFLS